MSCTRTIISNYYNKLPKEVPKFIYMKKQFGKKDMQSFYKVILLAHCISFSPFYKKMVNNVVMTSAFINNMDEPFCVGCPHGKNH